MKLNYTTSPHLRGKDTTARLMLDVVLALLPALIVGVALQGIRALFVTAISIVSAVAAEGIYRLITRENCIGITPQKEYTIKELRFSQRKKHKMLLTIIVHTL